MLASPPASTKKIALTHGTFKKWEKDFIKTAQFSYGAPGYALANNNGITDISPHPGSEPDTNEIVYNLKTGKPQSLRYARSPPEQADEEESAGSDNSSAAARRHQDRQKAKTSLEDQLYWDLTTNASTELHRNRQIYDKKVEKHEKEWATQSQHDTNLTSLLLNSLDSATIAQCQLHPDWKSKVLKPRKSGSAPTLTHDVMTILTSMYARGSVAGTAENLKQLVDYDLDSSLTIYQNLDTMEQLGNEAFDPLDPGNTGYIKISDLKSLHMINKLLTSSNPPVVAAVHRILKAADTTSKLADGTQPAPKLQVPTLEIVKQILIQEVEVHSATAQPTMVNPAGFAAATTTTAVVPPPKDKTDKQRYHNPKTPRPGKAPGSHCHTCFQATKLYYYHDNCNRASGGAPPPAGGAKASGLLATTVPTTDSQQAIADAVATATAAANAAHAKEIEQFKAKIDLAENSLHALIANVTGRD